MSVKNQDKSNRYQRGKIIINGTTKHDIALRYIDLIGSKLIKILLVPGIPAGVYKLVKLFIEYHDKFFSFK